MRLGTIAEPAPDPVASPSRSRIMGWDDDRFGGDAARRSIDRGDAGLGPARRCRRRAISVQACPPELTTDHPAILPPPRFVTTTMAGRGGMLGRKSGQRVEGFS